MDEHSWQLESLIKRAFERTKNRFLSYLLVWITGVVMVIGAVGGLMGVAVLLLVLTKSTVALGNPLMLLDVFFKISPVLLILWLVLIYIGNWIQLSTVKVLISEEAITAGQAFRQTRGLVLSYFWFTLLSGLFFMGLAPFGFLSLFYIFLLWGIWGSFSAFVFLQLGKRGLSVLWTSKQMVDQKFWGIVGRSLLIGFGVVIISGLISFSGGKNGGWTTGLSTLLNIFTTPLILCFSYEMYKNLEVPQEVKKPTVWIALSVIGFVIYVVLMVLLIKVIPEQFGANLKNFNFAEQQSKVRQLQMQDELKKFEEGIPTLIPIPTFSTPSGSQRL